MPLLPSAAIFAADMPAVDSPGPLWSTNHVLYLLASVVLPALGLLLVGLRMLHAHYKDSAEKLAADFQAKVNEFRDRLSSVESRRDQLQAQVDAYKDAARLADEESRVPVAKLVQVSVDLAKAQGEVDHLNELVRQRAADGEQARHERASLQGEVSELTKRIELTLAGASVELKTYQDQVAQNERRVLKALKTGGQFWSLRALHTTPKFRPVQKRRRAIVSVCNLKGGVGKTTVTAHLAAALVRKGYRVLLVDLDLQGSLSSLFLGQDAITERFKAGGLIQHFFHAAAEDLTVKILDYAAPILGGRAGLVAATDQLSYAELSITLRWLLMSGHRDTRFLLRKALHLTAVTDEYDITLLDCPPFLNVSCINALAASDYLVVPVLPSQKAVERVPTLLGRLREGKFRANVNPELKLLGPVANRTWGESLTASEEVLWSLLLKQSREAWGEDVPAFRTNIPRAQSVQECEQAAGLVESADAKLRSVFDRLALEVEGRFPDECRRPAAVLA